MGEHDQTTGDLREEGSPKKAYLCDDDSLDVDVQQGRSGNDGLVSGKEIWQRKGKERRGEHDPTEDAQNMHKRDRRKNLTSNGIDANADVGSQTQPNVGLDKAKANANRSEDVEVDRSADRSLSGYQSRSGSGREGHWGGEREGGEKSGRKGEKGRNADLHAVE
jgi:hypothetical protein